MEDMRLLPWYWLLGWVLWVDGFHLVAVGVLFVCAATRAYATWRERRRHQMFVLNTWNWRGIRGWTYGPVDGPPRGVKRRAPWRGY